MANSGDERAIAMLKEFSATEPLYIFKGHKASVTPGKGPLCPGSRSAD